MSKFHFRFHRFALPSHRCKAKSETISFFFSGTFRHSFSIYYHLSFDCFHIYDLKQPVAWHFFYHILILFIHLNFSTLKCRSAKWVDAITRCSINWDENNKQELTITMKLKWKRTSSVELLKNVNYAEFSYFPGRSLHSFDLSRAHEAFIRSFYYLLSRKVIRFCIYGMVHRSKISNYLVLSFLENANKPTCQRSAAQQKKGMLINLRAQQINGLKTT